MTAIDKNPRGHQNSPPTQQESKVTLHNGSTVLPGFSPPVLAEIEGTESERGRRLKILTQSSRLEEPVKQPKTTGLLE